MARLIYTNDHRRAPFRHPKPFELDERDRALVDWCAAFCFLTRDHAARLLGISHSGASKRIRALEREGYVTTTPVYSGFPNLIRTTTKGNRYTRWSTTTEKGNPSSPFTLVKIGKATTLTHTLAVMDTAVTYAAMGASVVSERIMRMHDRTHSRHYAINGQATQERSPYYADLIVKP